MVHRYIDMHIYMYIYIYRHTHVYVCASGFCSCSASLTLFNLGTKQLNRSFICWFVRECIFSVVPIMITVLIISIAVINFYHALWLSILSFCVFGWLRSCQLTCSPLWCSTYVLLLLLLLCLLLLLALVVLLATVVGVWHMLLLAVAMIGIFMIAGMAVMVLILICATQQSKQVIHVSVDFACKI